MSDEGWIVPLPADVTEPYEVFVNGVLQEPGTDYTALGTALMFSSRSPARAGSASCAGRACSSAWRHVPEERLVDVVYEVGGRRVVASGLPIIPPGGPEPSLSS